MPRTPRPPPAAPVPDQPGLFDDLPSLQASAPAPAAAVLMVPGKPAALSKPQKDFNRLSERLARLRDHLAAWQARAAALDQRRLTEWLPLNRQLLAAQRDAVLWIDAHLQQPPPGDKLTKKNRGKLVSMLRLLARAVLEEGPDAAVEAAHDRHSALSHSDHLRDEADMAAAVLGRATGDEALFEGDAASVEELLQRAAQRLQEQQAQQQDTADDDAAAVPPAGRQPGRGNKARQRDAQALKEASQSVRDVYRRLASALHPDREPDAAARQRKTALMARANQAYAANDLLALLAMQLELEQIDAAHLAGLPDDRLRHYNRVLQDQQAPLEAELAAVQMPVSAMLERAPGLLHWAPAMLDNVFVDELQDAQRALRNLTDDMLALRDARTRQQFLRTVEVEDPDEAMSPVEALMFEALLDDLQAASAPPPSRSGRGSRKRR